MTTDNPALGEALAGARSADRLTRIDWRDRIATHGAAAIDAVTPWVIDQELGAFAVRVIEATAKFGEADAAIASLTSVRRVAPSAAIGGDIDAALTRLRPPSTKPTTRHQSAGGLSAKAGWSWPGFRESDFGQVTGTSWRRRNDAVALIPLVLRPLLEINSAFATYPIYMSPEVHIADRDRYLQGGEWRQGWRASKLMIYAHGPTAERKTEQPKVAVGWYIEKGTGHDEYGPVEPTAWDWPRFLDLLRDPSRRLPLEVAAKKHGLLVGDYFGGRYTNTGATVGFTGRVEGEQLVLRDAQQAVVAEGWGSLLSLLDALPTGGWHDFHIWREWPAEVAIAMGRPFAHGEIVPVLTDLAHIYLDVIKTIARGPDVAFGAVLKGS